MKQFNMCANLMRRLAVLLTISLPLLLSAQGPTWVARYDAGLGQNENSSSVAVDSNRNVIQFVSVEAPAAGFKVLKYDPNGHLLWVRSIPAVDPEDYGVNATRVIVDTQDNIYIGGSLAESPSLKSIYVAKYDPNGTQLWLTPYYSAFGGEAVAKDMTVAPDGVVSVAGWDGYDSIDGVVIHFASDGSHTWKTDLNAIGFHATYGLVIKSDQAGNTYVGFAGQRDNYNGTWIGIAKCDPSGNVVWSNKFVTSGFLEDYPTAMAISPNGNAYVTGNTYSENGNADILVWAINSTGQTAWSNLYSGFLQDFSSDIALESTGDVVVCGESGALYGGSDGLVLKYRPGGALLWERHINNSSFNATCRTLGCAIAGNGSMVTTSQIWDGVGQGYDIYTTIWHDQFIGPTLVYDSLTHNDEIPGMPIIDKFGSVIVPASGGSPNNGVDALVLKYAIGAPVPIETFELYRGTHVSGSLQSLMASDDDRLVAQKGFVANTTEAPIQYVLTGTAVWNSTPQINMIVESNVSTVNLQQRIELFDWTTSQYVSVDERNATKVDTTSELVISTNASRFVDQTSKKIMVRVSYYAVGFVTQASWKAGIDLLNLAILPY